MAGGGGSEVRADDQDRLVRPFGEQALVGEHGGLPVAVDARPVRMRPLAGMMQQPGITSRSPSDSIITLT